ncbi:MAG: HAD-IIIC family phosphatase [Pseudomonadota bacterium]
MWMSSDNRVGSPPQIEHYRAPARGVSPGLPADAPKLIIWDLDDTLWQGTLADGDEPVLYGHRAAFVHALNGHGIVSAICSKNDHAAARARLEAFGLWDAFVFPRIAFLPKGDVVRQMVADMRLRPANVVFIDDNVRNLAEVAEAVPGIRVVDARAPDCDALLQSILDDHRHIAKSRVAEYRMLEARAAARQASVMTDEAFLLHSGIEATYTHRMDNLDFAGRIEELINRSNQLNYTASRVDAGSLHELIMNVSDYDVFCAFVWDRYGYYGLVGAAVFDKAAKQLIHFAFSCRIMHMGVEDYLLRALSERYDRVGLDRLQKALPPQSSRAIANLPFEDPRVRGRILAEESPRDWSKISLRLMCDCQSGAFHHYSRFRDEIDFDNIPRLFTLPMMLTGEYRDQHFPDHLVYTPATDYMDWRWDGPDVIDPAAYEKAARRFCAMIVGGRHKLLLVLPPENAPEGRYDIVTAVSAASMKTRTRKWNGLWRSFAARHPELISCTELGDFVEDADMAVHAYHYVPSALKQIAERIDIWFGRIRMSTPKAA